MLSLEPRGYVSTWWSCGSPILALVLTALISGGIFAFMGRPPVLTVYTFLVSPLFAPDGLAALAVKAAPLVLMGVGLSLAYRDNIWNIGTEGQVTLGAIAAGGLALALPVAPGWALFPAMIAAGILGGVLWALVVAWLRTSF